MNQKEMMAASNEFVKTPKGNEKGLGNSLSGHSKKKGAMGEKKSGMEGKKNEETSPLREGWPRLFIAR